ncbi:MAG: class IV adenylate cyclase [Candidatus Nealsonbacteria bacterium]
MNVEIEIKVKIDSFESIRKNLSNFGKVVKSIKQIDEYYVPCHRDFFAQKPKPVEWLRIRTNPDKVVFEYDKSFNKEDGSQDYADEYETEISQPDELRKMLEFLDFKKVITIDKKREYWDCGNIEVCLDDVKDLGLFIEVEAKGDFEDTQKAREECERFFDKIGINDYKERHIKNGYPFLILDKLKKEGNN